MPWSSSFARHWLDAPVKRAGQKSDALSDTSSGTASGSAAQPLPQRGVILRLENLTKTFPGVCALNNVQLEIRRGEVHAVCGENGAGKSTLMKIISGIYKPDRGTIHYKGKPQHFSSPLEAEAAGISIIHQELNLVPHLSAAENIFLAREPKRGLFIDRAKLKADTLKLFRYLGVDIDPAAAVRTLSVAQCQMVEIAKALSLEAEVLIMDEPTSSLMEAEARVLFKVIHELKRSGVGIIYISHRLNEMAEIADRVTILRDGHYVSTDDFAAMTINEIVLRMVGRSLDEKYPQRVSVPSDKVLFSVEGLTKKGKFKDISFDLRQGEILGFAGLMGAGRTEVARAIFGADPLDGGKIFLDARRLSIGSPQDAIAEGIAYLPEDRKSQGLAIKMPVASNMTLANMAAAANPLGLIDFEKENAVTQHFIDKLDIRTPSVHQITRLLSGGNQQKIIIGKWLFRQSRILFFDEPTRGIDVGAKSAIYKIMDELAANGIGVVLISSELPEILGMTDRVAVFHAGQLKGILNTRETCQEEILHYASGHVQQRINKGP